MPDHHYKETVRYWGSLALLYIVYPLWCPYGLMVLNLIVYSYTAREIERVFRGHMGRQRSRAARRARAEQRNFYFLHFLCIQMQRCFRGYYSRKYKHNQERRKEYCRIIAEKGREAVAQMAAYAQEQAEREAEDAVYQKQQQFAKLAQNLHHLTSTAHVRGVYNPVMELVEVGH
jgi:hypothetical protein